MLIKTLSIVTILATTGSMLYTLQTVKMVLQSSSKTRLFSLATLICIQALSITLASILFAFEDVSVLIIVVLSKFVYRFAIPLINIQIFKDLIITQTDCTCLNGHVVSTIAPVTKSSSTVIGIYHFLLIPNYCYFLIVLTEMQVTDGYAILVDLSFIVPGTILGLIMIYIAFDAVWVISKILANRVHSKKTSGSKGKYLIILRNLIFLLGLKILFNCIAIASVIIIVLVAPDVYLGLVLPLVIVQYCLMMMTDNQLKNVKEISLKGAKSQSNVAISIPMEYSETNGGSGGDGKKALIDIHSRANSSPKHHVANVDEDKIVVQKEPIPNSGQVKPIDMGVYAGARSTQFSSMAQSATNNANGSSPMVSDFASSSISPGTMYEEDVTAKIAKLMSKQNSESYANPPAKKESFYKQMSAIAKKESFRTAFSVTPELPSQPKSWSSNRITSKNPTQMKNNFSIFNKIYQEKDMTRLGEAQAPHPLRKISPNSGLISALGIFKIKSTLDLSNVRQEELIMNDKMDPNDPEYRVPGQSFFTSEISDQKQISADSFFTSSGSKGLSTGSAGSQNYSDEIVESNEQRTKLGIQTKLSLTRNQSPSVKSTRSSSVYRQPLSATAVIPETIFDEPNLSGSSLPQPKNK
jgi:hypothetical protein